MLKITTNNQPRVPFALHDLPLKVQQEFDYIDKDDYSERFVKYRGVWYDVFDTMAVRTSRGGSPMTEFDGWDSFLSETFFSGVLFKWIDDGDSVIVGSYYS